MRIETSEIVAKANRLIKKCGTRDPYEIAEQNGIDIIPCNFKKQKGAYNVILRNRFIFVKQDLTEEMKKIVILHELGHDQLHRQEASKTGGFLEFNIFDMRRNRMEYEANVFAAQIALPDEEILEYISRGTDAQGIAQIMNSDVNLVALKIDTLIAQGYRLTKQENRSDFLR